MTIRTVAVIGAGTMGHGIAHVAAQAGFEVLLCDLDRGILDRALSTISRNMEREVRKGARSEEDRTKALGRIVPTVEIRALEPADFLIEAVREDEAAKADVLSALDKILGPETVLASNTSSISITRLAARTRRPHLVIGMHFMNPVPLMLLVEVVRGLETSEETVARTRELAQTLGKTPVVVSDFPGFVSNRLLMPMINEAAACLMEGVGSRESIDQVMTLGMKHPMGPLALADLIGLDVCLQVMEVLHSGFGDSRYRPCPLLRKMVDAGHLGRKSGRGFYTYT
jgi:3-hydroxybutyryl-CoA dehydrogenase